MDPIRDDTIERLLDSYKRLGGINRLDGNNLPSKRSIIRITERLLRVLFPGYFDDEPIPSLQLDSYVTSLISSIAFELEPELIKSLEFTTPEGLDPKDIPSYARKVLNEFLGSIPAVREVLTTDIEAAYNGDPAALSRDEIILAYPFIECISVQRLAHILYKAHIPLIPRIMTEWAHSRTGMDLHPGAKIGEYFFVDHCTGTVVGETAVIGNHVKMYQGVGLVARSLSAGRALCGTKRHPTIEDHVTIYAGATIVGGDTVVGAYSTIGANVFLTHSVPPYSLVLAEGENVRVINKKSKSKLPEI